MPHHGSTASCWACSHPEIMLITEAIYCHKKGRFVKPWEAGDCGEYCPDPAGKQRGVDYTAPDAEPAMTPDGPGGS